jgi:hypothetical protein
MIGLQRLAENNSHAIIARMAKLGKIYPAREDGYSDTLLAP